MIICTYTDHCYFSHQENIILVFYTQTYEDYAFLTDLLFIDIID